MRSWKRRDALHLDLLPGRPPADGPRALLDDGADAKDDVPDLPDSVVAWLGQLTLLYGVPFEYLVPEAALLPPESLRFFFVDRNWLDRLTDGAISIGVGSTRDTLLAHAVQARAYEQVDRRQAAFRATMRGVDADGVPATGTLSGLLLRSVVVSGWPGLEVRPTAAGKPLPLLRMDAVADDVLLCIVNGVPDRVELVEPGEGLHFGVIGTRGSPTFQVYLRGLGYGGKPAGEQIGAETASGAFRAGAGQPAGVLDVATLRGTVQTRLQALGALASGATLEPGGFAIQMVVGAGLQPFVPPQARSAIPDALASEASTERDGFAIRAVVEAEFQPFSSSVLP